MKRYLLFIYERYYPRGGMEDLVGQFNTIDEALCERVFYEKCTLLFNLGYDFMAHIYDCEKNEIVAYKPRGDNWIFGFDSKKLWE